MTGRQHRTGTRRACRIAWGTLAVAAASGQFAPAQVPASDPAVPAGEQVHLLPGVANQHPRLLFTDTQLADLRTKALSPGNPFYQQLTGYLIAPPTNNNYVSDATEAQRQGFWRAPSVALHYAITGNQTSFNRTKGYLDSFLAQPQWETGTEDDSGMGAGNILLGAAIAYDVLHDDLSVSYRSQFRTKLLDQARKMYHLGHLQKNADSKYWQQDPQNNHRWHRNGGLALAVLTVADPNDPADDWILKKTKEELDFVHRWLPKDGSNHEGTGYAPFGTNHLALAFDAADRVLGTNYLQHDFFKNSADFRLATLTPGMKQVFAYGDANSGTIGSTNNYLFLATAKHRQADQQAALMKLYNQDKNAFEFGWMSTLWHDPTLTGGSIDNLSRKHKFTDIGLAVVRDGWEENDVALSFKTGPYGGQTLNEYRNSNNGKYINVAHDDPDANSFQIYARGKLLAAPDGYATTQKLTSAHNTILVNGVGQKGEGSWWTQPVSGDMTTLSRLVTFDDRGDITVIEGEAGNAYTNSLQRYRRTAAFVEGKYILILDDIRASLARNITWMVQGEDVDIVDGAAGRYLLSAGGVEMPFQLKGNVNPSEVVGTSTAEHRGASLGLEQLQATASTAQWRSAALFDAWGLENVEMTFVPISAFVTEIRVTGPGLADVWRWDSTTNQTVLTLVPEPAVLGVVGGLAIVGLRRRRLV